MEAKESEELEIIRTLLQQILVIELAKNGATQEVIAKKLGVGKQTVNNFLKGLDFDK